MAGDVDPYAYKNELHKGFFDFNMESQAEILAVYFMLYLANPKGYVGKTSNRIIDSNFLYEQFLRNFFIEIENYNNNPRDLKKQWGL